MQLTLDLNILLAIAVEPIEPILIVEPIVACRIFVLARLARLRHPAHQPFASGVFTVDQLQRICRGAQSCWQPKCRAGRHRAAVTLGRSDRPVEARRQHVLLDGGFERVVVRAASQLGSAAASRNPPARVARAPELHWAVVDGIRHAQNTR